MHPELTIPLIGAEIKAYTLFTVLGALAFAAAALPPLKRAGVKPLRALALLAVMALAFLTGARLWNVAVNPGAYAAFKWYSLRLAGFSMYGGVLGSALVLFAWARLSRTPLLPLLDAIVVPAALAFALARAGCYLNGCCCGVITSSAWGVRFPEKNNAQDLISGLLPLIGIQLQANRYPTQLFELAFALLGLVPALVFGRRLISGSKFLLYGAWFSAMRFAILPLRSLPYDDFVIRAFYPALYLTLTVLGAAALILINKKEFSPYSGEQRPHPSTSPPDLHYE